MGFPDVDEMERYAAEQYKAGWWMGKEMLDLIDYTRWLERMLKSYMDQAYKEQPPISDADLEYARKFIADMEKT